MPTNARTGTRFIPDTVMAVRIIGKIATNLLYYVYAYTHLHIARMKRDRTSELKSM